MSLSKSSIISQQNLTASNLENNYTYAFEDFRLDPAHLMLYQNGKTIALKPKVVETLVALVERRGEVVGKDELMNRLWTDSFVEESNLTQNIYLLRKTLGNCFDGQPFIETFARRGYRFNGKIRSSAEIELLLATHTKTRTLIEEEATQHPVNRTRRSWVIVGSIAACGLMILSGFAFWNFTTKQTVAAAPFQTFKIKRHSDRTDITSAIVSPDGKFIAFVDKQNALWLRNVATDSKVKILPASQTTGRSIVAFSPDNNHLYIGNQLKDKKGEIFKMSLFGGTVQQKITEDVWSGMSLSPDGKQLSFVRVDRGTGQSAIIVANTDGTGERRAALSKEGTWFGKRGQATAWSPDGSQIACTGSILTDGNVILVIKILRVADGEEISLIKPDLDWRWINDITWLPDGDNLLVISGDNNSQDQIYKHTISNGEWRRVTNDLSNYQTLSVTADGKTAVTIQYENPGNLWLMPADGNAQQSQQVTFGRNLMTEVTGVSWTPDGKIVYATNAGGRWEIWMINADGTNQKQLTQNCAGNDSCSQPFVSPDGRYIVFQVRHNGVRNIWRMDADGGNPTQLTIDGGGVPSFSIDGRFVIYTRPTSPAPTLWQIPIEGGEPQQFSKLPTAEHVSFSPDGKQMVFKQMVSGFYDGQEKQPWQTCVAPIGADAPEKCFGPSRSFPRWAPDAPAFYYVDPGYLGIWKQPLDGERELFLEFAGERTNNFAFSPDGKQLVVARSKPTQDIVALTDER